MESLGYLLFRQLIVLLPAAYTGSNVWAGCAVVVLSDFGTMAALLAWVWWKLYPQADGRGRCKGPEHRNSVKVGFKKLANQ